MGNLEVLFDCLKKYKMAIAITIIAAFIGAVLGATAYYNGWLG